MKAPNIDIIISRSPGASSKVEIIDRGDDPATIFDFWGCSGQPGPALTKVAADISNRNNGVNPASFLVHTGDFCYPFSPSNKFSRAFNRYFNRPLEKNNLPCLMTVGNHEANRSSAYYAAYNKWSRQYFLRILKVLFIPIKLIVLISLFIFSPIHISLSKLQGLPWNFYFKRRLFHHHANAGKDSSQVMPDYADFIARGINTKFFKFNREKYVNIRGNFIYKDKGEIVTAVENFAPRFICPDSYYAAEIKNRDKKLKAVILVIDTNEFLGDQDQQEWFANQYRYYSEQNIQIIISRHHPSMAADKRAIGKKFEADKYPGGDVNSEQHKDLLFSYFAQVEAEINEIINDKCDENYKKIRIDISAHAHHASLITGPRHISIVDGGGGGASQQAYKISGCKFASEEHGSSRIILNDKEVTYRRYGISGKNYELSFDKNGEIENFQKPGYLRKKDKHKLLFPQKITNKFLKKCKKIWRENTWVITSILVSGLLFLAVFPLQGLIFAAIASSIFLAASYAAREVVFRQLLDLGGFFRKIYQSFGAKVPTQLDYYKAMDYFAVEMDERKVVPCSASASETAAFIHAADRGTSSAPQVSSQQKAVGPWSSSRTR